MNGSNFSFNDFISVGDKSCSNSDHDAFQYPNYDLVDFFSLIDHVQKEYDSKNCDFSVGNYSN